MTVPSTSRRAGPFTGTGILTSYPFTFKVFEKADVQVTIADTNGLETVLVTDSTVLVTLNIDQDATPGGSVQYAVGGVATALPSGYMLAITGEGLVFNQPLELPQGGNFDPGSLENALDRLEMQVQLVDEAVNRTLQVAVTTPTGFDVTLPAPVPLTLLGWAADGLSLVNYAPDVDSAAGLQTRLANPNSPIDGDALLGVLRSEAGAVATTQHTFNQTQWLPATHFMTAVQVADVLGGVGALDVADALNTALATGKKVLFPPGKYRCSKTLTASNKTGLALIGIGDVEIYVPSAAGFTGASGAAPQTNCLMYFSGCQDLRVNGLRFNPDTSAFATAFPSGQWNHAIQISGCSDVDIEYNNIKAARGDGVSIGTDLGTLNDGVRVQRNYIHDCYRIGAVVVQGRAVTIAKNRIIGNKLAYGSVYGEGIGIEPDNVAHICNDITIDDNKVVDGGIYLVSRSALEGNTNNINITKNKCDHIYVRGAESGEVAGNEINCVPVDALGTATYGTGLWVFQASAPGGKAGCNRKLSVHDNVVNIANDATDPHPQAIGMVIGGLTDGQVHSNIVRNVGSGGTSVTRGIQYIAGIRTSVKKNKVHNFTEAFYIDNLSSYNDSSLVGTDASEDILVQGNEFYGLCFIRNNTAARITFKANYVRQGLTGTNSAVRVILTGGDVRVEDNEVFCLSTGTFGAIDITGDTSSKARVRKNTVETASQSGVGIRSTIDDCQIDDNYIIVPGGGTSFPIECADTVVVSVTDNKLDAVASSTNAILCATGVTGRAGGNKLLQTFTAPFRFRNTGFNARAQYIEVDQSPSVGGWANAQTWSAGQVVVNVPTAAAGDPAFVCTTAGSPGTWKAYANVDA